MATVLELARHAGVSAENVLRVVRGEPVSSAVAARVSEAIDTLGPPRSPPSVELAATSGSVERTRVQLLETLSAPFLERPGAPRPGPWTSGWTDDWDRLLRGKPDGVEMSPYARLVELCQRLAAATTGGQAEWAAEEETGFVCRRQSGSVGIRSRDRDGEPPYELVIYSPKGEKVENLLSEWSSEEEPAFWNPALAELYRAARRKALGVDGILDDLFAELPPARAGERTPA